MNKRIKKYRNQQLDEICNSIKIATSVVRGNVLLMRVSSEEVVNEIKQRYGINVVAVPRDLISERTDSED